ncbi:hypothetical protein [Sphingobium chlorophenolicum]|uniref:Uncharacterized protein n=1 Tax=Sphingobium chlorophenolicum TaxID=46429 RepID=A0A081RE83_SPHCR|nr:hypothetical protein [Sphingobium chlorophenolicum]KEQ53506.1 hypothetical protein BV95_02233 [Sphingobium chlorophenolicum]
MTPFATALLLMGPPPLIVAALPPDTGVAAADIRTVDLPWSGDVHLKLDNSGYELVVRFDRPIEDAALKAFAKAAGPDLADLRWNDDSLVLRAAVGRKLEAVADKRALHVRFLPDADPSPAPATVAEPQVADMDIELAIARAQADAAAGYPDMARRRLAPLAASHPGDKRIQRLLADMEVAEGALALGAGRYRNLAADDPFARQTLAESGGNAAAAVTARGGKLFWQAEAGLNAMVPVDPRFSLGAGFRLFRSEADTVYGPTGILSNRTSRSAIGDLLATVNLGPVSRIELQGSAQLDEKVAGAGLRLFAGPPERQVRLVLAYRLPDLATPEQSTFGGHISRAGIGGSIRLTPELAVQADGGWNGYGLRGTGARTRSFAVAAGFDYLLRRGSPSLAVSYRLDAEYVDRTTLRPNGLAYIPLSDRENHSFQLVSGMSWTRWQLTGAAGWTFDRKGKTDGPTANISATGRLSAGWRLQASGGVSSISRPGISGRQLYLRVALTRYLGRH